MFLRRNVASQVFVLPGSLRSVADGSAVTSGASITILKDGMSWAGSGTLTHISGGAYKYAPTQDETDCKILGFVLEASGAITLAGSVRTTNADPNDAAALGLTRVDAAISTRSTYAGGAVASVTGDVGGNVAGSVGSVVGNVGGSVTTQPGWYTAPDNTTLGYLGGLLNGGHTAFTSTALANAPTGGGDSAATIADAVWDEAKSDHAASGSFGALVDAAISSRSNFNPSTTGVVLASNGLDSIPITAPTGPATTFRGMAVQLWRRFFKASAKDAGSGTIKTLADDGSTTITTQAYTADEDGNETLGASS